MSLANKFNIPPALFETIKRMNEGKEEYQAKVKALMAKRGIKSLADLSPEEKKDFFNTLDSMHKAKNEEVELDEAKSGYDVKYATSKTAPIKVASFDSLDQAKAFLADIKKKGSNGIISQNGKPVREEVDLDEAVDEKKIRKDLDSGMSHDAVIGKHANKKLSNTDAIRKVIQKHAWEKRMKKEEVELDEAKKPVSKDDVTKLLVKYGNNPQSAKKMVDKEFDSAVKRHPEASASKIAEVIRSVAEEVELEEGIPKSTGHALVHSSSGKIIAKGNKAEMQKKMKEVNAKEKGSHYVGRTSSGVGDTFGFGSSPADKLSVRNEEVELDEAKSSTGYDLYHKDFSSAMQHAYDFAKKKYNIEIDPTEIDRNVAMGPRKPGSGKANAYRLLDKTGKKAIQVQVANLDNKRYELNMYKEEVEELDELSKKTLSSYIDKADDSVRKLARTTLVGANPKQKESIRAKIDKRIDKRLDAMTNAVKKMVMKNEEVEQIDEVKVGDKVSFSHSVAAAGGRSVKKTGTVHQIDGDTVHVKVKDKYGVMTHKKKASDLMKEDVELNEDAKGAAEKIETYAKALPSGDIDKKDFMKVASMLRRNKVKDAIKFTMSLDSDPRDYVIGVMQNNKINMKEEIELTESHFEIGDDVICKDSGMEGEVVKIDEPQTGKYYTVKREDGKMVKYAPDELEAEDEDEDEEDDEEEMKEAKDQGASKKKESEFHKKLDTLVHKTFGKRPEEMKEDLDEAFSPAQIDKMRQEYSKIKGIDPASDNYKKLTAMLDKLDLKTLQALAGAKIKFVSGLAQNRVVRKMNEDVEQIDEISAEIAKSVAQKRDLHFRKGTPTETQKRRMGRGDWRADPQLHADRAEKSAIKRGAKDVYDYNKKEEVEFDEASNPQISMKRAGLSVDRAKEVMRHQKEIGTIRKKREALRNSYDPSIIEAYKKMKKKNEVTKDDNQAIKSSDKLSGKQEPIELDPELKEQKR